MEKYLWGEEGNKIFFTDKQDVKFDVIIGADILFWPQVNILK